MSMSTDVIFFSNRVHKNKVMTVLGYCCLLSNRRQLKLYNILLNLRILDTLGTLFLKCSKRKFKRKYEPRI